MRAPQVNDCEKKSSVALALVKNCISAVALALSEFTFIFFFSFPLVLQSLIMGGVKSSIREIIYKDFTCFSSKN